MRLDSINMSFRRSENMKWNICKNFSFVSCVCYAIKMPKVINSLIIIGKILSYNNKKKFFLP